MMGTNYALPTAQLASVFSLVSFVVWISLGSQSIAAFQHYFANDFSFESNATNKNPDIETGTDIVENSEYADSPEDITLQNLLESPGFRVLPVADTMANNLQNTIQYKIHHWFNLVTFLLLIVKTVCTICCCQFQKKLQIALSVITTITGFTSMIIFTNVRVPAYLTNSTVWLYAVAWLSVASQILAGIAAVFLKPDQTGRNGVRIGMETAYG